MPNVHANDFDIALNDDERNIDVALCRGLPPIQADGELPEWLHLTGPGPKITGRDGRWFGLKNPETAIKYTEMPFVVDADHMSEYGVKEAPAYAWIEKLEYVAPDSNDDRAPGFWGKVDWYPRGEEAMARKDYRYLSPAVVYDRKTRELIGFTSVALTNKPNLTLTSLHRASSAGEEEEQSMNKEQLIALCAALGLDPSSDIDTILNAAKEAGIKTAPTGVDVVPRSDLVAANNRTVAVQSELNQLKKERFDDKVEAALNAAQEGGKMAPASRDFYKKMLVDDDAIASFNAEMESRPPMVADDPSAAKEEETPTSVASLSEDQKTIAEQMGQDASELVELLKDGGEAL